MGMSTHVIGIVPNDETWKKMKAIWDACEAARVEAPKEVMKFFGGEPPDNAGVKVPLSNASFEWRSESSEGIEVMLEHVPKHVKVIRFYNSW